MNMNTAFIVAEFTDKFREDIKQLLEILDSPRAGALFPPTFEDGVRYVYCQILDDSKRCKEIVECYTKLKNLSMDEGYIYQELRGKHYDRHLENMKKRRTLDEG